MHSIYREVRSVRRIVATPLRHLGGVAALILAITLSMTGRCEADWINSLSTSMPVDAIIGGADPNNNPLYVCRAYYGLTVQPGYAVAHGSVCQFGYGGVAMTATDFDWYIPSWYPAYGEAMPANAIPLGAEPSGNGAIYRYPCRVTNALGKYGQDLGGCLYPYGGQEKHQVLNGFDWLVDPGNNINPPLAATLTQEVGVDTMIGPYILTTPGYRPYDAMVAGLDTDGTPLYFCSGYFAGGMQPGKARMDWNACDVSWGGGEHFVAGDFSLLEPNYFYLDYDSGTCAEASDDSEPPQHCTQNVNPVPVGKDSDGAILWACLGYTTDGGVYPGKSKEAWGPGCDFALDGAEVWSQFESVLTDGLVPAP